MPTDLSTKYELRPFQKAIVEKFVTRRDVRHVLIGDDMGLGKSLEAMDLDRVRRENDNLSGVKGSWRPTLVITLMSVVPHWEDEYAWALPGMRVVSLDPKNRPAFMKAVQNKSADVYIMHWDALRLLPDLAKVKWFHIIGDEIHKVKNRKAQVTRALKKLPTFYKTGLSGTPADDKPHDLWSVLNWLYPKEFSSYWNFYKYYVDYAQGYDGYYKVIGVKNVQHLHNQMKTFYIRRLKEEVLPDLPDKYYDTLWVDLTPTQRRAYNSMKNDMLSWVGDQQDKPLAAPAVITKLLRLQQFSAATIDIEHGQRRRIREKFDEQKHLYWSQLPAEVRNGLQYDPTNEKWETVNIIKYIMVDPSAKLDAAMAMLESSDEPIVFFTQFKTLADLFAKRLANAGISHGLLTGDVSQSDRGRLIRDFQAGNQQAFVGTIKAGGTGITLTRSSHVTFFDRAWNPAINKQAEDRLHRIGQKNAVQVTDIMSKNTIDLGRAQQIEEKWTWVQKMLGDKVFDYQKRAIIEPGKRK